MPFGLRGATGDEARMFAMNPDLAPLVGSWRLLTAETTFTDSGERIELFGPNPEGRMIVTTFGRIMFILARSSRQSPTNDAERAISFNEMAAYTGLVPSDGLGRFIITVDLSSDPAWTGEQLRFFTINDDQPTIRTAEQTHPWFP